MVRLRLLPTKHSSHHRFAGRLRLRGPERQVVRESLRARRRQPYRVGDEGETATDHQLSMGWHRTVSRKPGETQRVYAGPSHTRLGPRQTIAERPLLV